MGFDSEEISGHDKILLNAMHNLKKTNREAFNLVIKSLLYVCNAEGVEAEDLSLLIRSRS